LHGARALRKDKNDAAANDCLRCICVPLHSST
jgi:hypothetical protein